MGAQGDRPVPQGGWLAQHGEWAGERGEWPGAVSGTQNQCGPGVKSQTNFENHSLNDMIDMVHGGSPEHLTSLGKSLSDAKQAITDAFGDIHDFGTRVDWQGKSGDAFRSWSDSIHKTALAIADYTSSVGDHMSQAATGLTYVQASMPPRDTRKDPLPLSHFSTADKVEGGADYTAAKTAESHRQEAINQMNRLASFYRESQTGINAQQVPSLDTLPEMGVPAPTDAPKGPAPYRGSSPSAQRSITHDSETAYRHPEDSATTPRPEGTVNPPKHLHDTVTHPDQQVGTHIDHVGTLPPETTHPTTIVTSPTPTGPGGGPAQPVPPFVTGPISPPVGMPSGRPSGIGGTRGGRPPVSGRVSTPSGELPEGPVGRGPAGRGPSGPVGRAVSPGEEGVRGPVSPMGRTPVGRSVTGGIPRAGGEPVEPIGGRGVTGAARTGGVVGGKPSMGAAEEGVTGSRIPRGTVVGGRGAVPGSPSTGARPSQGRVIGGQGVTSGPARTGARLGQGRVIGARPEAEAGTGQTVRRPARAEDGVVGTPKSRVSSSRSHGFMGAESGPEPAPIGKRGSARAGGKGQPRAERSAQDKKRASREEQRDEQSPTD